MTTSLKSIVLPAGTKRLAFIESTGTQWLDTGIQVQPNLRVVVDVCCEWIGGYETILFGGRTVNNRG